MLFWDSSRCLYILERGAEISPKTELCDVTALETKSQMVREAGAAMPIFSPVLYFAPEPSFKMRWLSQWSKIYF